MRRALRIGLALAIGAAVVLGDLALDCRVPASEACVWGKAYLPLGLTLGTVLAAVPAYLALSALAAWRTRRTRGR